MGSASVAPIGAPSSTQWASNVKKRVVQAMQAVFWKWLQIVVGCGFCVILHTEWFIAAIMRVFYSPPALKKSRPTRDVHLLASASTVKVPAAASVEAKQSNGKPTDMPAIMIRAVAAAPDSVKPIMVYNDTVKGHNSEAWRLVGPYMKLYGRNAIANSQLFNPEFIHFFVPGMGSLPYIVADIYCRVLVSVIGDPLCHPSNWRTITEMFVKEFPGTFFYHASAEYAQVLHDMGYYINDVGAETTLQVQQWTYSSKTRTVRAAARSARDAGVRVREVKPEELTDEMRQKLQYEVSGDWLQQKAVADRELRVFVRNVDYDNMQLAHGVRIFVAEQYYPASSAPPVVVDQALQGLPLNVKPPKPPRPSKSGRISSQGSLSRSNSVLTSASSLTSMASGLLSSMPSLKSCTSLPSDNSLTGSMAAAVPGAPGTNTPFATATGAVAAAAPAGAEQQESAEEGVMRRDLELIGFVLLDPLWQANDEIGYVSSICRMKRSAHQGTLKLLYEDIISKLRSEGKRELAFGFAPFFNVRDDRFARIVHWIRWTNLYFYHCANNLYAFQNLAFSKIRYGAGVDGDKFRDPNVTLTHIYMASPSYAPGMQILDLYVLCMYVGFMGVMFDTLLKLVGLRRGGANLVGADCADA